MGGLCLLNIALSVYTISNSFSIAGHFVYTRIPLCIYSFNKLKKFHEIYSRVYIYAILDFIQLAHLGFGRLLFALSRIPAAAATMF